MLQAIVRVFFPLLLFGAILSADVIELKTGEQLEGTFKQANSAGVVIEVGGQSINMPLAKVRAIYFGARPPAAAQLSAPETKISAAHEALKSLKALRVSTEVGTTLRDYVSRLTETKIKVDEYLDSAEGRDYKNIDFNGQVKLAMKDYEKAAETWRVGVGTDILLPTLWKSASNEVAEAELHLPAGQPIQKRIFLVPEK